MKRKRESLNLVALPLVKVLRRRNCWFLGPQSKFWLACNVMETLYKPRNRVRWGEFNSNKRYNYGSNIYKGMFFGELIRGRKYDFTKRPRKRGEVIHRLVQYLATRPPAPRGVAWTIYNAEITNLYEAVNTIVSFFRSVVVARRNYRERANHNAFCYAYGFLRDKVCMQEVALFMGVPITTEIEY